MYTAIYFNTGLEGNDEGVCMLVSSFMLFNIHTLMHACTPACSHAWSILIDHFTAHLRHLRDECLTSGHKTLRG